MEWNGQKYREVEGGGKYVQNASNAILKKINKNIDRQKCKLTS